jgi:hypothetical protein
MYIPLPPYTMYYVLCTVYYAFVWMLICRLSLNIRPPSSLTYISVERRRVNALLSVAIFVLFVGMMDRFSLAGCDCTCFSSLYVLLCGVVCRWL